jgi:hypothetical protein
MTHSEMTTWTAFLMVGVTAIWISMVSAVAYLASRAPVRATMRARGLEPPRAARPSGT